MLLKSAGWVIRRTLTGAWRVISVCLGFFALFPFKLLIGAVLWCALMSLPYDPRDVAITGVVLCVAIGVMFWLLLHFIIAPRMNRL